MNSFGAYEKVGGRFLGVGFRRFFKLFFSIIFIIIPIIYAVIISLQSGGASSGILYLGQKFLNPLNTLGIQSAIIIKNHAAFISTNSFFSDLWNFIKTYWSILGALYIIYIWIKAFGWIFGHSPLSNDSQKFINFSLGLITFLVLTFLYLSLIASSQLHMSVIQSWNIPINSISNFIHAIPYMVSSANSIVSPQIR